MRILLVCRNFLYGGGVSSRWGSLTQYLAKRHEMCVLTNVPKSVPKKVLDEYGIRMFSSPIKTVFSYIPFMSPFNTVLVVLSAYRTLSITKADLIVVTVPELEEGVGCMIISKLLGIPLLVDVRDLIVEDHVEAVYSKLPKMMRNSIRFMLDRVFYGLLNSSIKVVTVTSTLRENLVSEGTRVPIDVIPNGAEIKVFYPAQPDEKMNLRSKMGFRNGFLILYAGAMGVAYYPMDVVFRAIKIVVQSLPSSRLLLCGTLDKKTRELMKDLGGSVKYLGRLDLQSMADLMRVCDIGVITMDNRMSTFCALTTKFFEYLASGLPVVASCPEGGELDRLITEKQVGYAVPSGNYKSMAERLVQLLTDDQKRQAYAKNGVRMVISDFNREKEAETYDEVLVEVEKAQG